MYGNFNTDNNYHRFENWQQWDDTHIVFSSISMREYQSNNTIIIIIIISVCGLANSGHIIIL